MLLRLMKYLMRLVTRKEHLLSGCCKPISEQMFFRLSFLSPKFCQQICKQAWSSLYNFFVSIFFFHELIACPLTYLRCYSCFENPRIAPLTKIFSYPFNSSSNPELSSKIAEILPSISTVPEVGVTTPVMIFNNVDFPAPFFPKTPTASPLGISTDKSFNFYIS